MVEMTKTAIAAGYRHLDTAEGYGTEAELGQAIKESGIPREQFFATSKGMHIISEGSVEDLPRAVDESLKRLGLECLDM
jgi:diketogulonate reductase-like aldo/keto reductase